MGLFKKKEEEQFDAFETDRSETFRLVGIFILIVVVIGGISLIAYSQYIKWKAEPANETNVNYSDLNFTNATPITPTTNVTLESGINVTSPLSADGIYYYTTRDKITGELCYIDDKRVDCSELTNTRCSEDECRKELETVTECFINNQKIDCP